MDKLGLIISILVSVVLIICITTNPVFAYMGVIMLLATVSMAAQELHIITH